MPASSTGWGQLTDSDFELIDVVVKHVLEFGSIPGMASIAVMLKCTRQGVGKKMAAAERRGILRPRPRYATNWFELTPLGEDLYRERSREARETEQKD